MIGNLIVINQAQFVPVSCTTCWQTHQAFKYGSNLILLGGCSKDPRRYFLDHDEYIAYVRRYQAEGGKHIEHWDQPETLPMFTEVVVR